MGQAKKSAQDSEVEGATGGQKKYAYINGC